MIIPRYSFNVTMTTIQISGSFNPGVSNSIPGGPQLQLTPRVAKRWNISCKFRKLFRNIGKFSGIFCNLPDIFGKFPPLCNPTQTCLEVYSNPEDLAYLDQVCLISVGAKPSPGIEFETNALAIRCQCKSKLYLQSQEPSLAQQIPHVYCKK